MTFVTICLFVTFTTFKKIIKMFIQNIVYCTYLKNGNSMNYANVYVTCVQAT